MDTVSSQFQLHSEHDLHLRIIPSIQWYKCAISHAGPTCLVTIRAPWRLASPAYDPPDGNRSCM